MVTLGLTVLKGLAIGLIVFPEPSTTVAGVALLGVAHFLYKRHKAKNGKGMQKLVSVECPVTAS